MFGVCNIYDILEIGFLNRFSKKATSIEIIDQSHGDQVVLIQLAILDPNQFMSFSKIFRQKIF